MCQKDSTIYLGDVNLIYFRTIFFYLTAYYKITHEKMKDSFS